MCVCVYNELILSFLSLPTIWIWNLLTHCRAHWSDSVVVSLLFLTTSALSTAYAMRFGSVRKDCSRSLLAQLRIIRYVMLLGKQEHMARKPNYLSSSFITAIDCSQRSTNGTIEDHLVSNSILTMQMYHIISMFWGRLSECVT